MQAPPPKMNDAKKNLFADLSTLYSKPITRDDDILDYIPTQYIAEYAKNLNYDGIAFRSSLAPELAAQDTQKHPEFDRCNIVVFNYQKCRVIKSNVVQIVENYIECEQIDASSEKLDVHSFVSEMLMQI